MGFTFGTEDITGFFLFLFVLGLFWWTLGVWGLKSRGIRIALVRALPTANCCPGGVGREGWDSGQRVD